MGKSVNLGGGSSTGTTTGVAQNNKDFSLSIPENKNALVLLPITMTKIKIGNNSRLKFEQ